jgi:hypothetical protein
MRSMLLFGLVLVGCTVKPPDTPRKAELPPEQNIEEQKPEPKLPCPVKITALSVNKPENGYTYVRATVRNISKSTISGISLSASRTDAFGDVFEPYKTDLTSDQAIPAGGARAMYWEVLMDERTQFKGKPKSGNMFLSKIAFSDGKVVDLLDLHNHYEGCTWDTR